MLTFNRMKKPLVWSRVKKATVEVLSKKPSKPKIVVEKIKKFSPEKELIDLLKEKGMTKKL